VLYWFPQEEPGEPRFGLDAADRVVIRMAELDPAEPFPVTELGSPRGRQGSPRRVVLPEGWLDDTAGGVRVAREETTETTGG